MSDPYNYGVVIRHPDGTVWECDHGIRWTAAWQGGWMSRVRGTAPPDTPPPAPLQQGEES